MSQLTKNELNLTSNPKFLKYHGKLSHFPPGYNISVHSTISFVYHFLAASSVLVEELEYLPNEYSALSTEFVNYPPSCPEALLEPRCSQIQILPYGPRYFAPNPTHTCTYKIMKNTDKLNPFKWQINLPWNVSTVLPWLKYYLWLDVLIVKHLLHYESN